MKNKIALYYQFLPPIDSAVSIRGYNLIKSLSKFSQNLNISAYCSNNKISKIKNVNVKGLNLIIKNDMVIYKRLFLEIILGFKVIKNFFFKKEKPNLIIISSPNYFTAIIIFFFSIIFNIKYVIDVRDLYPQVFVDLYLLKENSLIYKILSFLSNKIYNKSSMILCTGQGLKKEIKIKSPKSDIQVYYNGFSSKLREVNNIKHEKFTLCFHGTLGYYQDIKLLLKIALLVKPYDINIVIIGYGIKEKLIKDSKLSNLNFLGKLSFDKTIYEISRCHMGISTRIDNHLSRLSFPVKIWEYIGLGIPSIVCPLSEAGDFIKQNKCGFVFKNSEVNLIVKNIVRCKKNKKNYEQLTKNCKLISKKYTRENLSKKIVFKLNELMNQHEIFKRSYGN